MADKRNHVLIVIEDGCVTNITARDPENVVVHIMDKDSQEWGEAFTHEYKTGMEFDSPADVFCDLEFNIKEETDSTEHSRGQMMEDEDIDEAKDMLTAQMELIAELRQVFGVF